MVNRSRRVWSTPSLSYDGELKDLVQAGGGKQSTASADPGESLKPKGGTSMEGP